jgi:hypothetical protein
VKFINSEEIIEDTMDMYQTYLTKSDCKIKKILRNKMKEWCRDDILHINFKIGGFDLNDNMKFSQVWYCNIYLHRRIVFFHYFRMNPFSNSFLNNHQKEKE